MEAQQPTPPATPKARKGCASRPSAVGSEVTYYYPAAAVAARCGGYRELARLAGVNHTRAFRYVTGEGVRHHPGLIPINRVVRIIRNAMKEGIYLGTEDFFERAGQVHDGRGVLGREDGPSGYQSRGTHNRASLSAD